MRGPVLIERRRVVEVFLKFRAIRAPEFAFACSRTIETMPIQGAPMSLDFHSTSPAQPAGYQEIGQHTNRRERLITMLATSLAVMIVAAIAVLMGMA